MTRPRIVRSLGAATITVVVGAFAVTGCSSGGGGSDASSATPTSSTALVPGAAKIVSFDVPQEITCAASATNGSFAVSWSVTGAKRAVVQVDGAPLPGTGQLTGSTNADVHCDPLPHDVVLIATDKDGHFTTDRKIIKTNGGAGS